MDKIQIASEHSSAGVWGSIYYEVSEDEIQKEISDYKNSIKLESSCFTDDEIRDFCIKSLVSYKVGLQSYTNPENKKPPETTIK